ncbi:MAG TPA: glycosyltransferase family 9 protein [Candidatus Obscuribacterales bacterium]
MTERKKLLVINFGGIGDEVLFLPTLASIRKKFPDWRITLLLEPRSRSIIQLTNLIDDTLTFDIKKRPLLGSDLVDLLMLLRSGSFDVVLSSGSSPMVASLLFLSGIPARIGYDSGLPARLFLTAPVPLNRNQYAGNMYRDLATGLGIESPPNVVALPQIEVPQSERESMEELIASVRVRTTDGGEARAKRKRIVIHPGTSKLALEKGLNKTWPAKNWIALIEKLAESKEFEVILAGGPDDKEAVEAILSGVKPGTALLSTFGKTKSLLALAALIDVSSLLVCVDSAPMHIAIALGKPIVALFGPTDEAKLVPKDKRFMVLRKESSQDTLSAQSGAPSPSSLSSPSRKASYLYPGAPAVQLQPDSVYQCVLDQLRGKQVQDSFQEAPA